jgi:type II secretory pathway pseudopilin PulG
MTSRRGLFIADAVAALAIVGVLTAALVVVLGRQRRAAHNLADMREATRAAEAVLADLQAGRQPRDSAAGGVTIRPLPSNADDKQTTPAGQGWVEVEVTVGRQRALLAGLVPADQVPRTVEAP